MVANERKNPTQPFLEQQGALIIDGGLATELEARGYDLDDELWSAKLLLEAPEAIRQVHADYLTAGADCIISATYQATIAGFMKRGLSEAEAVELLRQAVRLAIETRDTFWAEAGNRLGRLRPLVAASVGPYGAYMADGSEYTGRYDLDEEGLLAFHRQRWQILAGSGADLLACETIPSYAEARALSRLLLETPDIYAWFSFSCQDCRRVSDGTPLVDCVAMLPDVEQVAAVGINCTAPQYVPELVTEVRRVTDKPIVVYPNSGEQYDAARNRWLGTAVAADFAAASLKWRTAGAALIGGCCRTRPEHVGQMRQRLVRKLE